jgi:hypothetical protein
VLEKKVMSEYQYYEFQAIDRPLDERAMMALRAITSRATITPTSLVNVYHWGDFKGNPDRLMDQYFDAHLYVANWGTRRFMLRLPVGAFPLAGVKPYTVPYVLKARASKEHVVLDFNADSEDGDEDFEGGEGWLASLIPLRSDLLTDDLRSLYLAWLVGVQNEEVDEDKGEPPVPPGLRQLSAPLRRLADFLRLDLDLVEIAATVSREGMPSSPSAEELAAWIAELAAEEKDSLLVRLMQGEGVPLASELLRRFRQDHARRQLRTRRGDEEEGSRRTVGDLRAAWHHLAEERRRRAAERAAKEQARRAREQAAARARHLDALVGREESLWRQVETAIQSKQPKQYDHAIELLQDLRDLGERAGTAKDVAQRIRDLRERHHSKPSLMQRLDRAGLPKRGDDSPEAP